MGVVKCKSCVGYFRYSMWPYFERQTNSSRNFKQTNCSGIKWKWLTPISGTSKATMRCFCSCCLPFEMNWIAILISEFILIACLRIKYKLNGKYRLISRARTHSARGSSVAMAKESHQQHQHECIVLTRKRFCAMVLCYDMIWERVPIAPMNNSSNVMLPMAIEVPFSLWYEYERLIVSNREFSISGPLSVGVILCLRAISVPR